MIVPKQLQLDCIKLKRNIQHKLNAETEGMTSSERMAYYGKLAADSPWGEWRARQIAAMETKTKHA